MMKERANDEETTVGLGKDTRTILYVIYSPCHLGFLKTFNTLYI